MVKGQGKEGRQREDGEQGSRLGVGTLPDVWPQGLKVKIMLLANHVCNTAETTNGRTVPCEHRVT